jgi:hypothetical protein
MPESIYFAIPLERAAAVTEAILGAVPPSWQMVDGPIKDRGLALFCKVGDGHEHEARCHIVPAPWEGSYLSGREAGPQPPRVKLRGKKRDIKRLLELCTSLGLKSYEPQTKAA